MQENNSNNPLYYQDAINIAALIRKKEISVREVMSAFLERIDKVNPKINAICTLRQHEDLLLEAEAADGALLKGIEIGPLFGLPIAIKDLALTRNLRTTYGSLIYKDFIPDQDELFVERIKKAGAIIIGKTNAPEFGAGSHTFNKVFGITGNPYNLNKSAGGSSGGAAAALAAGMVPIADGSDLGGSLRNPAGFCNVVGFRPSPGRVPSWPTRDAWSLLPVEGPMARSVKDVALLLSVMAGPDPRVPVSIDEPGNQFLETLDRDFSNTMIAWSPDLGQFHIEPEVIEVCEKALPAFQNIGCIVDHSEPDFSGSMDIFQTLRALIFADLEEDYLKHRDLMKDTVIWNIEKGLKLTGQDINQAVVRQTELYHRVCSFFEKYDFLILPTAQVLPFDVEKEWISEINGQKMGTYLDWMSICCVITLMGLPVVSVPCGFSSDGLPVGIQIVGKHHRDFEVLQLAHAFEGVTQFGKIRPDIK
ncbi:MAG: hypothetical protein K9L30_11495 [Desulfobacterales bacterium]|nr:hypothetical protein [Desulfobacterales bacterium]